MERGRKGHMTPHMRAAVWILGKFCPAGRSRVEVNIPGARLGNAGGGGRESGSEVRGSLNKTSHEISDISFVEGQPRSRGWDLSEVVYRISSSRGLAGSGTQEWPLMCVGQCGNIRRCLYLDLKPNPSEVEHSSQWSRAQGIVAYYYGTWAEGKDRASSMNEA